MQEGALQAVTSPYTPQGRMDTVWKLGLAAASTSCSAMALVSAYGPYLRKEQEAALY